MDVGDYGGDLSGIESTDVGSPGGVASVDVEGSLAGAPDIGSLGGTLSDVFGENSATMGGETSEGQANANFETGALEGYGSPVEETGTSLANIMSMIGKNRGALTALALAVPALAPAIGLANLAAASQTAQGAAQGWGSALGTNLGGAVAGAPGAIVGGLAGNALGGMSGGLAGYAGGSGAASAASGIGDTGMDLGGIAGGLAGLYSANQAANQAGGISTTLGDLYGQNSPYAQALRQQLERRDAAAGRRSQYGPREVELQAQLARMYSQNAPATLQAQKYAQAQRNARLNTLLGLGKATGAFDFAKRGLQDIFSTPVNMTGFNTPTEMPSYTDFAGMNPTTETGLGTGTYGMNDLFLNY